MCPHAAYCLVRKRDIHHIITKVLQVYSNCLSFFVQTRRWDQLLETLWTNWLPSGAAAIGCHVYYYDTPLSPDRADQTKGWHLTKDN